MINVDILGPLAVTVDGMPVTPTAPKPRQVLALLATSANSVVRNERIIEELWEDQPPVSVTTTLQTYVYQLRKQLRLAPAAGPGHRHPRRAREDALRTFAGGYMLSLEPDALDATRFEHLARLGTTLLESGATEEASHTLSRALGLWNGSALVDVSPGPILQVEMLRLDEIRKSAVEARITADLQLGRHSEVVSELIGLVAQHPTHEGFQGKLMLALYRAGRRSGALHAYQRARGALVAELGVEPSRELQRLHQAILAGDGEPHVLTPQLPMPRQMYAQETGPMNHRTPPSRSAA